MKNWYAVEESEINEIKNEYNEGEKLKDIMESSGMKSLMHLRPGGSPPRK